MTGIVIAGWSAVTSAGIGVDAVRARVGRAAVAAGPVPGVALTGFCGEALPQPDGHLFAGLDVRAELGRKGTSSYDRATGLAVVCAQDALREASLAVTGSAAGRVGVALGTSMGSFRSTSDYSRETLTQHKPYLVNPVLFPNTVMNGAAGQVAIRFGLRGVNATIAGGALAFVNALRYACGVIDSGYADVMLTGAVEEFSPHRAWAQHLAGRAAPAGMGEAAGLFVLAGPQAPDSLRDRPRGRVLGVATGFGPGGPADAARALTGCVRRVLRQADVAAVDVTAVLTTEAAPTDRREYDAAVAALGTAPRRVTPAAMFGDCDAATSALGLAVLLARGDGEGTAALGLLTALGPDGAVGAALVEGGPDAGDDRR